MSLRDKYTNGLLARGWIQIESTSRKVKTFKHEEKAYKLFLGKAGSIRYGRIKTASIPVPASFKSLLLTY